MKEIGVAAYLVKPMRHEEIIDCLAAVLSETVASEQGAQQSIVTRHTIREMRRGSVRILLAEDNITNQQVAMSILKRMGLMVDIAANGAEAVRALELLPYDLVLMDCLMPNMDGYEASRLIRNPQSSVLNHGIPIIAMTANAMKDDRKKCLEAGMNDYISKPVYPQTLAEVLEKWLPKEDLEMIEQAFDMHNDAAVILAQKQESSETLVFNIDAMKKLHIDDVNLKRKVIKIFIEDTADNIKALRNCLETGDAEGATLQAHSIKSASAYIGGETLRAAALEMEKSGKAGNLEGVARILPDLDMEFMRLKAVLEKHFFTSDKMKNSNAEQ